MQRIQLTLLLVLINTSIFGQDRKAVELLNASISALGGKELLNSIKTLRYVAKGHEFSIEQSDRPEGPYLVNYFSITSTKNFTSNKCLYGIKNEAVPFPTEILVDKNQSVGMMRKRYFPMYEETDEQMALAPEVVATVALANNPRFVKDTTFQSVPHSIVAFTWRNYPVRLLINTHTNLVTGVEIARPINTVLSFIWGDVKRMFVYSFWQLEENGLHYPHQTDVFINDYYPLRTIRIDSIKFNMPTARLDSLTITNEIMDQAKQLEKMMGMSQTALSLNPAKEIRPGIHLIEGSWNTTLVKTNKGIMVLETPLTSAYSKMVLQTLRKSFPNEKIIGAITTSDAWPHLGGVREYVANRIPLYILDVNEKIISNVIKAKFITQPDSLQRVKVKPDLRKVSSKVTLGEGVNRIELYPFRTESGERMMMVYFPTHKLLYTSDLVQKSRGKFFMPQYLSEVVDAVKRENLTVENIFGMHIGMIDYNDVLSELESFHVKSSPK